MAGPSVHIAQENLTDLLQGLEQLVKSASPATIREASQSAITEIHQKIFECLKGIDYQLRIYNFNSSTEKTREFMKAEGALLVIGQIFNAVK
jgi:hypothetical protein